MDLNELSGTLLLFHRGSSNFITGITNNSKDVKKGFIFIAIKGTKTDGHLFVEDAIKKGASAVVLQDKKIAEEIKSRYPQVNILLSDNTRETQAVLARRFFDEPDKGLKIIGVTGTNGKTTTANLIYQYLLLAGKETGIIGTINYRYKETVFGEGRTTPDAIEWYRLLNQMKKMGAEYVVSEISSHALDQYRVHGTEFEGAVFTNLTQEHLDYHRNMENYFQAKKKLYRYVKGVFSINTDDFYGNRLYQEVKNKVRAVSYGREGRDFKIVDEKISVKGTEFTLIAYGKKYRIKTNLLGFFNIYNTVAAISLLNSIGFEIDFLVENAVKLKPVKGRFETIYNGDFLVVNDYAHTPDALEKVLQSLKKLKHNRIIVVFGAGGDRDKEKRPVMGSIAERYADKIIITSDNPRSEDPLKIIEDIKKGIKEKDYTVIPDRKEAIKKAIEKAKPNDIVLIAGKGHENYQIIGEKIIPFDDTEIAKLFLKERGLLC